MRHPLAALAVLVALPLFFGACRSHDTALGVAHSTAAPGATFDHSHARWTALLARHVRPTGVDYEGFRRDKVAFDAYLAALQGAQPADLESWSENQRFAFWINVYNAYTIRLVAQNCGIKSIRDLGDKPFCDVFDKAVIPLKALHPAGTNQNLSLNDIEHEILRPRFEDARAHAAVNCASASCPPLLNEAFVADRLDAQLDKVMRRFVNDPARNTFDCRKRTLYLSKIFKWFESDFVRDAGSVQAYVARYADPARVGGSTAWIQKARLRFKKYSWRLNAAPRR